MTLFSKIRHFGYKSQTFWIGSKIFVKTDIFEKPKKSNVYEKSNLKWKSVIVFDLETFYGFSNGSKT